MDAWDLYGLAILIMGIGGIIMGYIDWIPPKGMTKFGKPYSHNQQDEKNEK